MPGVRVVVPFTRRLPEVVAALPDAEWVDVSGDDEAYWRLVRDLWRTAEDFAIVEHDVVPAPEILASLDGCTSLWCAASYRFENFGLITGLGCTRFSGTLTRFVPDALDLVASTSTPEHPPRHWCSMDARLSSVLRARGFRVHEHGEVRHLGAELRSHEACRP